jgi:hypothetical protein
MWTCKKCCEQHEEHFESCWNCGLQKGEMPPAEPVAEVRRYETGREIMDCLRCGKTIELAGVKMLNAVPTWEGFLGSQRSCFEVYVCSGCGKAEFYLQGVPAQNDGLLGG